MFGFKKQKFCDGCDMPIEECECEICENCNELPVNCNCEVCEECNNFMEYCECDIVVDNRNRTSYCSDCGMHNSECECNSLTEQNLEEKCKKCGGSSDGCVCDIPSTKVEESGEIQVDVESEVIVIEEPPSFATKIWRAFLTLLIIVMTLATLAVFYFTYETVFKEKEPTNLSVEQKFDLATDLLVLIYNARDVKDIIGNQEFLMAKVTPELYPKLDVSKEELYLRRYGAFSNSAIEVSFNSYTKSKSDNQIVLNYTVTSTGDLPVQRMAIMEFSMDKKLTGFLEYTVNEIK